MTPVLTPTATTPSLRPHTHCRVCKTALPAPYLSLGEQPFANALRGPHDLTPETTAPLEVARCSVCNLSQLTVVIDPAVLYADYPFRSGASATWKTHCEALAEQCGTPGRVLDIACNDGALLDVFRAKGWKCAGVDPSPVRPSVDPSLLVLPGYWNTQTADDVLRFCQTPFDIITAQNVLGHVNDPIDFLKACAMVLAPDGQLIIEVPHVGEMIERMAFDTIYHEHLSYWSLAPLDDAAAQAGLVVLDVEPLDTHGGSRRYWLGKSGIPSDRVIDEHLADMWLWNRETYPNFALDVIEHLALVNAMLDSWSDQRVWAWGASAKGAVLLNALKAHGNTVWPEWVVDCTPAKQGKRMPGLGMLIRPPSDLSSVDILWCLSWNNADEIERQAKGLGFTGTFFCGNSAGTVVD